MVNRRLAFSLLACALLPVAGIAPAAAQTATLVRDINPLSGDPGAPGSNPRRFTSVNGRVVFLTGGEDPAAPEYRLWATDGAAAEGLAVLCSHAYCPEPLLLGQTPGLVFYWVADPGNGGGFHIWRTDGTPAGTFPVGPRFIQNSPFSPGSTVLGRALLFGGCLDLPAGSTCGLWKTDGTTAGTVEVKRVPAYGMVSNGSRAVFNSFGSEGTEIWVTDGTPRGTQLAVKAFAAYLTVSGSRIFFLSGGEEYPSDLWVSDGTKKGTRLVQQFTEGFHRLPPITSFLKAVPGGVAFVAIPLGGGGTNLWRSDGTPKGTRPMTGFLLGEVSQLRADQIAAVGNRIFFVATNVTGPRLWTTRGTPEAAAPVLGCAGGCAPLAPNSPVAAIGNRVVYAAKDTAHGAEPWTSDGTGAGTRLLRDLCAGPCGSAPKGFTPHGGRVDFRATWNGLTRLVRTDGVNALLLATIPDSDALRIDLADVGRRTLFAGVDRLHGVQPWVTDGSRPGTRMIAALEDSGGSSAPRGFTVLGDKLLFTASDGDERSVWVLAADGALASLAGTGAPAGQPGPSEIAVVGGAAYFAVNRGPDGAELWRTDGTPAGTARLASFQDKILSDLRGLGGKLAFRVTATNGEQPVFTFWTSDGTPAGTAQAFALPLDTVRVSDVEALGNELYFLVHNPTTALVYRGDGTAAGTRRIFTMACDCGSGGGTTNFVRIGGNVYFIAPAGGSIAVFRTDGTAEGTVQAFDLPAGLPALYAAPGSLFAFQGDLYFLANEQGNEGLIGGLWKGRSDGALEKVKDLEVQGFEGIDPDWTVLGGRLYFRAADLEHGTELWRTDGTAAGTVMVKDIAPGVFSSDPRGMAVLADRLWFSALDPVHGRELWTSDGTEAGTRRVEDIAPAAASSAPEELTPFAGRLFFSADDQAHGREPWEARP
ncbi:MAG: ELWxxDGT repeat protein [Thermoanaerobaculia bacterium]